MSFLSALRKPKMPPPVNSTPLNAEQQWSEIQDTIILKLLRQLETANFKHPQQLSRHLGWGRRTDRYPFVSDPHYFLAEGVILRVSTSVRLLDYLHQRDGWILPTHGDMEWLGGLWSLSALNVDVLYFERDKLRDFALRPVTAHRLHAILTSDRRLRRATKRHKKILAAIAQGGQA